MEGWKIPELLLSFWCDPLFYYNDSINAYRPSAWPVSMTELKKAQGHNVRMTAGTGRGFRSSRRSFQPQRNCEINQVGKKQATFCCEKQTRCKPLVGMNRGENTRWSCVFSQCVHFSSGVRQWQLGKRQLGPLSLSHTHTHLIPNPPWRGGENTEQFSEFMADHKA